MNERIQDLATEVGISVDFLTNTKQIVLLEKFAELIVRECADVATINAHQWASPGTYVLKYFGVEE